MDSPATFGALLPLTGNFAPIGAANVCGIQAALQSNSHLLTATSGDSRGEATPAISEYKRIREGHSTGAHDRLAIFVQRSSSGMAVNPLSQRDEIPLFGAVGHPDFVPGNKYAWQFWISSDDEGGAISKAARSAASTKAAMLTVDDEWSVTVSNGFRDAYQASGGGIVLDETVLPSETDLKPLLLRIKRSSADVLFLNIGINQLGVTIRQARALGLSQKIYSTFWVATKDVLDTAGNAAHGVMFVEMSTEFPLFKAAVRECAGAAPSSAALAAYSAAMFLIQTLRENPNVQNTAEMYQALLRQTEIRLPDGPIPIRDRRVKFPLALKEVTASGVVVTAGGAWR